MGERYQANFGEMIAGIAAIPLLYSTTSIGSQKRMARCCRMPPFLAAWAQPLAGQKVEGSNPFSRL